MRRWGLRPDRPREAPGIRVRDGSRGAGGLALLLVLIASMAAPVAQASPCEYWVAPAPTGSDSNPGTPASPWATLGHAAATVPDGGCTVWVLDGTYAGATEIDRRFATPVTFRALNPYRAVLESSSTVVWMNGARNVVLQGFELRHSGPGAAGFLVYVDSHQGVPAEYIVVRDNVLHDSYGNDILKLNEVSRFVTIEGNVFYNQAAPEQHIDANSVTDVVIQDNVFFNDFARSGRAVPTDTKHFIVVKDSNEALDGLVGSERITIRRNVFMNWQGGRETFVQIGNDGKAYHEAKDVRLENNLMIGNTQVEADEAFGIAGARDVIFDSNTVVGDLPASAYAFSVGIKGLNPPNENIRFVNNIWSDPTGTMGAGIQSGSNEFSNGDPAATLGLLLDNNLYWNGGAAIPPGGLVSPLDADARRTVADPGLNVDQGSVVVPYWTGSAFLSGNATIRQEFVRLVQAYGAIPAGSPAVGRADPSFAPPEDILGIPRDAAPDLGAYESASVPTPPAPPSGLVVADPEAGGRLDLSWSPNIESDLAGYRVYRSTQPAAPRPWTEVSGALLTGAAFSDLGLTDGVTYWYYVTAVDTSLSEGAGSDARSGTPTGPATVTLDLPIASGSDDAEESASGTVSLTSSDLELVYDGSNQTVGLRFAGVGVPRGATITNAYVQFEVDEVTTGAASLLVQGQAADYAAAFTTASSNISSRPRTARSVSWVPATWPTVQVRGPDQRTPDLSPVIQEIVDRPGWASGNALALIVTGTGKRTAESSNGTSAPVLHVEYRLGPRPNVAPAVEAGPDQQVAVANPATLSGAVSDDGLPDPPGATSTLWSQVSGSGTATFSNAGSVTSAVSFSEPGTYLLRLTVDDGELSSSDTVSIVATDTVVLEARVAAGSDDAEERSSGSVKQNSDLELVYDGNNQTVGMRFAALAIPPGATITSAYIQFKVDETSSGSISLLIQGQAADDALAFTSATRNVSSRIRTSAQVSWGPPDWTSVGAAGLDQRTPDLSSIIREIVGRSGWSSGNAIVLIVTGTGKRVAEAFEGDAAGAPLLHIEYR